jgi:hypothetical protein
MSKELKEEREAQFLKDHLMIPSYDSYSECCKEAYSTLIGVCPKCFKEAKPHEDLWLKFHPSMNPYEETE